MTRTHPPAPRTHHQRGVGELLREWRHRRRVSQLELAVTADVSARHLSFVETGRAAPSRDMVLLLCAHLDVPLRERNQLLLAAGYAPVYAEHALTAPELAAVRDAVRGLLRGHEPYPAVVVDRKWNLVEANSSIAVLVDGVAPALLEPPVNVLRATLHPNGMAPRIANLGEWRAHLLGRLRREVDVTADPDLTDLLRELRGYPCAEPVPEVLAPNPGDLVVPLRFRYGGIELAFFSTVATFGTPLDVTLAELSIESFFPANAATAAVLRGDGNL
ncbi:helix-turn-helix domain-containing protein [Amycolatopsis arida]|uniref:helix-turn-helix domain-containing protein n=1 Tax=Amycolatopsis arida TaxID=587909 RepID=UPI001FBB922E|nr:helix-turn-helix transcriptional regulator [Amycolatopsis arida]